MLSTVLREGTAPAHRALEAATLSKRITDASATLPELASWLSLFQRLHQVSDLRTGASGSTLEALSLDLRMLPPAPAAPALDPLIGAFEQYVKHADDPTLAGIQYVFEGGPGSARFAPRSIDVAHRTPRR